MTSTRNVTKELFEEIEVAFRQYYHYKTNNPTSNPKLLEKVIVLIKPICQHYARKHSVHDDREDIASILAIEAWKLTVKYVPEPKKQFTRLLIHRISQVFSKTVERLEKERAKRLSIQSFTPDRRKL